MSDKNFLIGSVFAALPFAAMLGAFAYAHGGIADGLIAFFSFAAAVGCAIVASYFWTK